MFKLLRYFSLTSAMALIVTAGILVVLYRQDQMAEHVALAEAENTRLASTFANSFWRQFSPLFLARQSELLEPARARGYLRALDIAFESLTITQPILKINITDREGMVFYSPVRTEIGQQPINANAGLRSALAGRASSIMEFRSAMTTQNGGLSNRWVVETNSPIQTEEGQVVGALTLISDVTPSMERLNLAVRRLVLFIGLILSGLYAALFLIIRRADSILRAQHDELIVGRARQKESEERFRAIADYTYDWESWLDQNGHLRWLNPAVERLAGYSPKQCLEMEDYPLPIVLAEDRERVRKLRDEAVTGALGADMEFRLVCGNGKVKWVVASFQPIFSADNTSMGSRWSIRDITERVRVEKQLLERTEALERSNSELQQFAYVASHDLQEPLRTVTSFLQLLQRRCEGQLSADANEYIGYAVDGARRMHRLITDLLIYSRVTTHGERFRPVEMENVLKHVLTNLGGIIGDSGAVVTLGMMPAIVGDELQLISLFQNLIGNGIKYRGADVVPRIHVDAVKDGDDWVFSIKDNGIGIDPQYFDRIFIIFQRLHGRNEYEGTGIGLAVAKKIVERHGGRIWVDSVPGEGSVFHVRLPAQLAAGV
ncbi:PAS sensor signal transduction histidine kinase [Candidatus Terasakiella magnetica]|nr:PAS sensor signal transduction histidine kinase [Candidatus Terasakiella magnetica]